jgi:hypothetical protein
MNEEDESKKLAVRRAPSYHASMQVERRRAERDRRECGRVPVVLAVRNTVGGRFHLGQSEDIGPAGITLRRPRDLPVLPETPISLSFDLPGLRQTIDVAGLVVTDRRHGGFRRTGVRFVQPSSEQIALLSEFCRRKV